MKIMTGEFRNAFAFVFPSAQRWSAPPGLK
jgi:hypothetical protein